MALDIIDTNHKTLLWHQTGSFYYLLTSQQALAELLHDVLCFPGYENTFTDVWFLGAVED